MNVKFPLIEIEGPPRERGIQYGKKAVARIHKGGEVYKKVMASYGCSWDKALELANKYAPHIKKHSSDLYEELEGIAQGAEVDLAVVIIINGRSELMQGYDWEKASNNAPVTLDDGCTSVLATPDATQNKRLIHSQNWDWRQECLETSIVLRVTPETGPTILTFVEAGGLARCGMNSAGIAITGNGLESNLDYDRTGIPLSAIRRQALQAETMHDALAAIYNSPRAVSNNMLLSAYEPGGVEVINLETSPEEIFVLYPENGLLTHANHFESPVAQVKLQDTGVSSSLCSLYRSKRARSLLEPKVGNITMDDIKLVLTDRFSAPRGISRSPGKGSNGDNNMTVASIIMDNQAQEMYVCSSPWNNDEFVKYSVKATS